MSPPILQATSYLCEMLKISITVGLERDFVPLPTSSILVKSNGKLLCRRGNPKELFRHRVNAQIEHLLFFLLNCKYPMV